MNTEEKPAATLGKIARPRNGQELVRFKDVMGNPCILQTVRTAFGPASLRIGIEKAQPKIQAYDARAIGMPTTQKTGLIKYPVPPEVRIETQVLLTYNDVSALVGHLVGWLHTGTLEPKLPPGNEAKTPDDALSRLELDLEAEARAEKTEAQKAVDKAIESAAEALADKQDFSGVG